MLKVITAVRSAGLLRVSCIESVQVALITDARFKMEQFMNSLKSDRRDSTTADVETQLVLKGEMKRDPLEEPTRIQTGKPTISTAVFAGFAVCSMVLWIVAVSLTCFFYATVRDSEERIAVAFKAQRCLAVLIFIIIVLLLVRSRCGKGRRLESDSCFPYCALINGLALILLGAVLAMTIEAQAKFPSMIDRVSGPVLISINFFFGVGNVCCSFYYFTKYRC